MPNLVCLPRPALAFRHASKHVLGNQAATFTVSGATSSSPSPVRTIRSLASPPELRRRICLPEQIPIFQPPETTGQRAALHSEPPDQRRQRSDDEEPAPNNTPPPTDFERMDVLGATPVPATSIEACLPDGFRLNGGVSIFGGAGALLVNGEAFAWRPWLRRKGDGESGSVGSQSTTEGPRLLNGRGQWEVPEEAFGLLGLVWPRPDLLIIGLGPEMRPLSPTTRRHISALGLRVDVLDTRNAASQFNLLATERGVTDVAAALIPLGWKEGTGAV